MIYRASLLKLTKECRWGSDLSQRQEHFVQSSHQSAVEIKYNSHSGILLVIISPGQLETLLLDISVIRYLYHPIMCNKNIIKNILEHIITNNIEVAILVRKYITI